MIKVEVMIFIVLVSDLNMKKKGQSGSFNPNMIKSNRNLFKMKFAA